MCDQKKMSLQHERRDPLPHPHSKNWLDLNCRPAVNRAFRTVWARCCWLGFAGAWILGLLLVSGCVPADEDLADAHDLPVHYPADLGVAEQRVGQVLRQLEDGDWQVTELYLQGHSESEHSPAATSPKPDQTISSADAIDELAELVGWLPTLAARSDLGESQWLLVRDESETLGNILSQIQDSTGEDRRKRFTNARSELAASLFRLQPAWDEFRRLEEVRRSRLMLDQPDSPGTEKPEQESP